MSSTLGSNIQIIYKILLKNKKKTIQIILYNNNSNIIIIKLQYFQFFDEI